MIESETVYQGWCNRCGAHGYASDSEEEVAKALREEGWNVTPRPDGMATDLLCPKCQRNKVGSVLYPECNR